MQKRVILYVLILSSILLSNNFSQEIIVKNNQTGTIFEPVPIDNFEYGDFPEKRVVSKSVWISEKLGAGDVVSFGGLIPRNLTDKLKNWGFKLYGLNSTQYRFAFVNGMETDRYSPSQQNVWWDHVLLPTNEYASFVVEFYINQKVINQAEVRYEPLETISHKEQPSLDNTISQYTNFNLTGKWVGTANDETGPGKMTLYLEQKDRSVTGSVIVTNDKTGTTFSGTVNGGINSNKFLGEMVFNIAGCNIKVRFNSYLQGNQIIGNYDSQSNCAEQVKDGRLNLFQEGNTSLQESSQDRNNPPSLPNEDKIKSDLLGKQAMTQYGLWVFSSLDEIRKFSIKDNKITGNLLEFTIEMRLSDGYIVHVATATVNYKLINGSWEIYNVEFRRFY